MTYVPNGKRYDGTPFRRFGLAAVTRIASFALMLLALLSFAPSLRAIPSDQLVDASSLPDAPNPRSLASSPTPQPDSGDPEIVSRAPRLMHHLPAQLVPALRRRPTAEASHPPRQGMVSHPQPP